VAGRATGDDPAAIVVDRTCHTCGEPHGRPRLPGTRLEASISHSGDIVAVALAEAGPVGVDIEQLSAAEQIARDLEAAGKHVLLDDRNATAGEKFADADLLGMPTIVVVGKALADGQVEVKDRRTGERSKVAVNDLVTTLTA